MDREPAINSGRRTSQQRQGGRQETFKQAGEQRKVTIRMETFVIKIGGRGLGQTGLWEDHLTHRGTSEISLGQEPHDDNRATLVRVTMKKTWQGQRIAWDQKLKIRLCGLQERASKDAQVARQRKGTIQTTIALNEKPPGSLLSFHLLGVSSVLND